MPSLTGVAALVAAALCGGAWGWRVGTKRIYRRSVFKDDDESRGTRGFRRRVRQRYWTTFLYALVSALVVLVLMMATQR